MRKLILALSLMTVSWVVHAENTNSMFMWQDKAGGGRVYIAGGDGELNQPLDSKVAAIGNKLTTTGWGEWLGAEYGINDNVSINAQLGWYQLLSSYQNGAFVFNPSLKTGGMIDPMISEKTRFDLGPGVLKFGLNLGLGGITPHKFDGSFNANAMSGAYSATLWTGYEMPLNDSNMVGARLTYSGNLTPQRWTYDQTPGSAVVNFGYHDSDVTGAQMWKLDAFYEYWYSLKAKIGLDVNYSTFNTENQKDLTTGVTTDLVNGSAGAGAALYGVWVFNTAPLFYVTPYWTITQNVGGGTTAHASSSTLSMLQISLGYMY